MRGSVFTDSGRTLTRHALSSTSCHRTGWYRPDCGPRSWWRGWPCWPDIAPLRSSCHRREEQDTLPIPWSLGRNPDRRRRCPDMQLRPWRGCLPIAMPVCRTAARNPAPQHHFIGWSRKYRGKNARGIDIIRYPVPLRVRVLGPKTQILNLIGPLPPGDRAGKRDAAVREPMRRGTVPWSCRHDGVRHRPFGQEGASGHVVPALAGPIQSVSLDDRLL